MAFGPQTMGGTPTFAPTRPTAVQGQTIQQAAPANHKAQLLGILGGAASTALTGNPAPLLGSILGHGLGGAVAGAIGGGQQQPQQAQVHQAGAPQQSGADPQQHQDPQQSQGVQQLPQSVGQPLDRTNPLQYPPEVLAAIQQQGVFGPQGSNPQQQAQQGWSSFQPAAPQAVG